jgi:hypothetical protein
MPDPNLPLLEDAVHKLTSFLDEIVFVGGIALGLLITDKAAAPIRGTNDVDVIAKLSHMRTTSRSHNVSERPTSQKMMGKTRPGLGWPATLPAIWGATVRKSSFMSPSARNSPKSVGPLREAATPLRRPA